ncbi:MAG: ATP-binding cassette domain-containing protein [Bacillota bacterium]|nr:ATP-binding cassette domain-containing protein [Bacillota bacterium]
MDTLIELRNASKRFGKKVVFEDVQFKIMQAQTLALTGQNGSGKSTLLRIIAGLSNLSSGQRLLSGERKKLRIGYVPEHFPKLHFTPNEYLTYMGSIQGLSKAHIQDKISELFDMFSISSMQNTYIKYLSKGSIQKIAVIQALLSEPELLLLDEPLSGQDSDSQASFIDLLHKYKKQGLGIVLACHEKFLVDKLADRVAIIRNKKIDVLSSRLKPVMTITFRTNENFVHEKPDFEGILSCSYEGQSCTIICDKEKCDNIIYNLLNMKCSIESVNEC